MVEEVEESIPFVLFVYPKYSLYKGNFHLESAFGSEITVFLPV